MSDVQPTRPDLGTRLQSLPRPFIYLLLICATLFPLLLDIPIPSKPTEPVVDLYAALMTIPADKPVMLSTEWTNGTRAESRGEFEALVRILMHRNIKFVIFSIGDGQAPTVASQVISDLNIERKAHNERPYVRWEDWISVGFYANGEGTAEGLAVSVRKAFAGKQDLNPQGSNEDVFDSPVLKSVSTLADVGAFVDVTASATDIVYIQRLAAKTTFLELCTGVMGPEAFPYYSSNQTKGLASGLRGVIDLETLMVTGVNFPDKDGKIASSSSKVNTPIPGIMTADDERAKGRGHHYNASLHLAIILMILTIAVGNIGMFLAKRGTAK